MAASGPAPGRGSYRELTVASVVLGVLLGALMTAAFVYIALKLGFTLPGSTVAAILGFAVLRGILRKGSIVENNINQTVASGVNTASAGVAFTLPALFLLGAENPELAPGEGWAAMLPFILAGISGSFLGIVLIIPLRKQMIEFERLRFPSGIAVASLLKSPGAGARQGMLLGGGFLVGGLFTTAVELGFLPGLVPLTGLVGLPEYAPVEFGISFASLGAGLLAGRGGLPFVFGGMLAWWVISPLAVSQGWVPDLGGMEGAGGYLKDAVVYSSMLRPLGIGILIGGALAGVVAAFPALKSALGSLSAAAQTRAGASGGPGASDEMSSRVMYIGLGAAVMVLFAASLIGVGHVSVGQGALIAVVGTIWLAIAGLIVAEATGMTDISPLSGMALIGVTLMFFLTAGNIVAAVLLGVAICIGIGQCADMMADLKSGHLVGSRPKAQQTAQFLVAWIGVPVAVGAVFLFWRSPGFGAGMDLSAPQGQALAAVMHGLSTGDVALDKYVAGTALGAVLGLFPVSGVGVLVGLAMYLPFYITVTYGIGCAGNILLERGMGHRWMASTLVPVSAGFIIGEALPSLVINAAHAVG
ncbi:MAG: OPT/YSL family transporter [Myxococcota bacterium]